MKTDKDWFPEPWNEHPHKTPDGDIIFSSKTGHVGEIYSRNLPPEIGGSAKAHIGRILACVNGCVNIPNPEGLGELIYKFKLLLDSNCFCECHDEYGKFIGICERCKIQDALRACGIETTK